MTRMPRLSRKVATGAFWLGGGVFLLGIAPFLIITLLMKMHFLDPTLNPVIAGLAFVLSCPLFLLLIVIGIICRFAFPD